MRRKDKVLVREIVRKENSRITVDVISSVIKNYYVPELITVITDRVLKEVLRYLADNDYIQKSH